MCRDPANASTLTCWPSAAQHEGVASRGRVTSRAEPLPPHPRRIETAGIAILALPMFGAVLYAATISLLGCLIAALLYFIGLIGSGLGCLVLEPRCTRAVSSRHALRPAVAKQKHTCHWLDFATVG